MFWLPPMLPSGFDGVEPYAPHVGPTTFPQATGVRELARELGRSPSHICRVLKGERKPSAELRRKLARRGFKVKEGK